MMIFESGSDRSRAEPTPAEAHPVARRHYARGFDSGEQYGYTHGWRYGIVCGIVLCSMLGAAAVIAWAGLQ